MSKQKLILPVMGEGAVIPISVHRICLIVSMADQACKCSYIVSFDNYTYIKTDWGEAHRLSCHKCCCLLLH